MNAMGHRDERAEGALTPVDTYTDILLSELAPKLFVQQGEHSASWQQVQGCHLTGPLHLP